MDELLKQKLMENGADVEGTLQRFRGNGDLYLRFLKKLKDDQNYAKLKEYVEQGDYEEAFKAAHTVKGVSANLGLTPILDASSALTELFRNKTDASSVDMPEVNSQMAALDDAYGRFMKIIEEMV